MKSKFMIEITAAFCLGLVAVMSPLASGQTKGGSTSKTEQEVLAMERELVTAGLRGDAAAADRLIAADYIFMTRDGVVHENQKAVLLVRMKSGLTKAELLSSLKDDESDQSQLQPITIADTKVRVYGDTGVVIVRSSYKSRGKDGSVVETPTRFMHVWGRREGRWQLIAGSSTRIEQSKP